MNLFLDTSSLFKLYHREADTPLVETVFVDNDIRIVFLSEIAKVEFTSTVWKKARMKEISVVQANGMLEAFEEDREKYVFLLTSSALLEQARTLFARYGLQGLRTLDSIQFAAALSAQTQVQKFVCSDRLLHRFMQDEGLPTW